MGRENNDKRERERGEKVNNEATFLQFRKVRLGIAYHNKFAASFLFK